MDYSQKFTTQPFAIKFNDISIKLRHNIQHQTNTGKI